MPTFRVGSRTVLPSRGKRKALDDEADVGAEYAGCQDAVTRRELCTSGASAWSGDWAAVCAKSRLTACFAAATIAWSRSVLISSNHPNTNPFTLP